MNKIALFIFVIAISAAISACSVSPDALRRTIPMLDTSSPHNSELVSKCIFNGWGNKHNLKSDYKPTMFGHTVTLHINDKLAHIIDISNTLQGSTTIVYSNINALGNKPSLKIMKECHPKIK
ncbi:hypothetical protein KO527_21945 [Pseudoalteromonas sp. C2R02]|uniref:hypothetical protein n=1 Tax=Pseudoalteromonas sp. C2R02 TaxID=2841565 RepID=UPI001C0A2C68|nr:hypothetical protein [Pseudoalteromonas sp. C2R02]MBU2972004.1 hypothetical protein [Pseudoalteromonas sp. C2R02]